MQWEKDAIDTRIAGPCAGCRVAGQRLNVERRSNGARNRVPPRPVPSTQWLSHSPLNNSADEHNIVARYLGDSEIHFVILAPIFRSASRVRMRTPLGRRVICRRNPNSDLRLSRSIIFRTHRRGHGPLAELRQHSSAGARQEC